jgi:acyl-[acyl-carrier-protein]-phospholipid O-acyltransferase/long-chain-fatty-acid--[acyl-carrier-protein] ligase
MCAVLPLFHSFGFTAVLWTPVLTGCSAWYHPNPLDGATVARMVREGRLSILLATPTFLQTYVRRAQPDAFKTLRSVVTGAEKLRKGIADAFEARFGIRPLEGYGTTELSPVVALNLPDVKTGGVSQVGTKEGSIGHPIPGVAVRVVDPATGEELPAGRDGMLLVHGPNVMQGYLDDPGRTAEVLDGGWYVTGDIARVDEDGFVFIVDRLSRFSKIGGEMVPHLAVEEVLNRALGHPWPALVVTSVSDERKGEQLVVCYTETAGDVDRLVDIVRRSDLPNLWKPRRENFVKLDAIPVLASGKLDLRGVRERVAAWAGARRGDDASEEEDA